MRCLSQNKQTIYYAEYQNATRETDDNGFYTGDVTVSYGTPQALRINVSPARGTSELKIFGIGNDYTKTLVTDDTNCPITETSVLWIGIEPYDSDHNAVPHNYVVVRKAISLNSVTYAVKEVSVT